jgi:ion channel-forming bestrophin family protein
VGLTGGPVLTKPRYSLKDLILWTRWESLLFLLLAGAVTAFYRVAGFDFLQLPWAPIAIIGTAVAFIIGFQNNAAYGRIWEARKIWGGIVNVSRSFGFKVNDMVSAEHAEGEVSDDELRREKRILIERHVAWLTALRHAMRQPKSWEEFEQHRTNREWSAKACIPERRFTLSEELSSLLSEEEQSVVSCRANASTTLLFLQSKHLRELKERGLVWEFSFLELENVLHELVALQGKSERIKNFPYPRQYATLSHLFVWIFLLLLPFAAIPEFAKVGARITETWPAIAPHFVWSAVPFCALVAWVFHTMERIGRVGENPFEGSANDVPISTIARGIEIDLRQQFAFEPIPDPIPELHNVQM